MLLRYLHFATLAILSVTWPADGWGQERALSPETLTLDRALQFALGRNQRLKAVREAKAFAEAELTQALMVRNPVIGVGVLPSFNDRTRLDIGIGKSIEIGGQRGIRKEIATTKIERADWEIADQERLLRAAVKRDFFAVLIGQERVALADSLLEASRQLVESADLKLQLGYVSEFDRNLARVQFINTGVVQANARVVLVLARKRLNLLMGQPQEMAFTATGPLHFVNPEEFELGALLRFAFEHRPDARIMDLSSQVAQQSVSLARRRIIPDLVLSAGFERDVGGEEILGGSLGVAIPLFNRRQVEIQAANAQQRVAEAQRSFMREVIEQEVSAGYESFQVTASILESYEKDLLRLADRNQEFALQAYGRGELDISDAIITQQQHHQVHLGYLEALLAYDQAAVQLEQVVGGELSAVGNR